MNLPFFIARRYLFSKGKKNFINIISGISVLAVAIITAAIIIVLSVFNGLGELLHTLNNSFDPQIKIEAVKGKSFTVTPALINQIKAIEDVQSVTEVIQDYAYAKYHDATQLVTIKGVSDSFLSEGRIPEEKLVEGSLKLKENGISYAILGYGVKRTLSVGVNNDSFYPLQLYYVKNARPGTLDPSKLYTQKNIIPGGVFSIIQNFDESYVIVPLAFAQELLSYGDRRTAIEVKLKDGSNAANAEAKLQTLMGEGFDVLNNEEQHKDLYRVLKLEKFFALVASVLLLIIGSINIYFSLMMLALDKKKDISILAAAGADSKLLFRIFLVEGVLIASIGTLTGLLVGGIAVLLQQRYGLVSMGMESAVTDGYPIKLVLSDFVYVLIIMSVITSLISFRPAILASRFASVNHL